MRAPRLGFAVVAIAGCTVASVDLAGKRCPCVDGYVCDTTTGTCVTPRAEPDDVPEPPSVEVDAGPLPPLPPPNGRIVVSELSAVWATPQQVRWRWTVTGDPADFAEYQLRTGTSLAQLEKPESVVGGRLWTRVDCTELGLFAPRQASQATPLSVWSVTFDHVADTDVFAQVFAIDKAGNATKSSIVSTHTARSATASSVVFSEKLPAGAVAKPAAFKISAQDAFVGTQCFALPVACGAGETSCQREASFEVLPNVLAQPFQASDFARAYVEFALGGDAFVPGKFSTFELQIGSGTCKTSGACVFRYGGFGLSPSGAYRRYQVPLSALVRGNGDAFSHAALQAEGFKLYGTAWSGEWKAASTLRVDVVRVRW